MDRPALLGEELAEGHRRSTQGSGPRVLEVLGETMGGARRPVGAETDRVGNALPHPTVETCTETSLDEISGGRQ